MLGAFGLRPLRKQSVRDVVKIVAERAAISSTPFRNRVHDHWPTEPYGNYSQKNDRDVWQHVHHISFPTMSGPGQEPSLDHLSNRQKMAKG